MSKYDIIITYQNDDYHTFTEIVQKTIKEKNMKPISFYLVTDTHYLNNILEPGGEAFEKNMVTEQFFVKESGAIISSTFDKIIEDHDTDIVILPGDFVKKWRKRKSQWFYQRTL